MELSAKDREAGTDGVREVGVRFLWERGTGDGGQNQGERALVTQTPVYKSYVQEDTRFSLPAHNLGLALQYTFSTSPNQSLSREDTINGIG